MLARERREQIDALAADLLRKSAQDNHVNLEQIIKDNGLELSRGEFEKEDIVTAYYRTQNRIYLSTITRSELINFALAVELGYHLINHDIDEHYTTQSSLNDPFRNEGKINEEVTQFATSILMPRSTMLMVWDKFKSRENISYFFKVSNSIAQYRILDLELE